MLKWFEQVEQENTNIICSKVRLARNWAEYVFPSKLSIDESREMLARLNEGLKDLGELDSELGLMTSLMLSCTETVFYTMSIYCVSAGIKKTRYTLPGALLATFAGIIMSVVLGRSM